MKISFHERLACPGHFNFFSIFRGFDFANSKRNVHCASVKTPLQKELQLVFKKYTYLSYFLNPLFILFYEIRNIGSRACYKIT